MNSTLFLLRQLFFGLLALLLLGCQDKEQRANKATSTLPKNEVILADGSPKRSYIREDVVKLDRRPLMESVTGKITYNESLTSRITSPIAGRVTQIIANPGDQVRAGQALAELNSPDLGQAQSDYAEALADLGLAERAYQRVQDLYKHGIVPRKDLDQARDDLVRTRSEGERTRLKLVSLGVRSSGTDNRFILHAPIAGIVTERNINPGMEIRSDLTNPLFVISDLSRLWVQMDVFEKDINLIHIGASAMLQVPAYPGESFPATINYIGQVVDDATRTVKVRCLLLNPDKRLMPSMYAVIDVQSDANDKAVIVPLTALFTEDNSDWLFVALKDGHYQKRPVKVGLRLKDRAIIQDGLKAGERLVIDGALLLRTEEDAEQDSEGTAQ